MMSCKEASRLVSEMRDHPLPLRQRIGLRMHLAVCRVCNAYKRQLEWIGRMSRAAGDLVASRADGPTLSDDARARIKKRLIEH